ncbi:four-carbon acid sugar kinase family protein [Raineyella fluvialis]|nr:four-carbon acid sugar kinase family protein [Raineyella fluvialis]
MTSLEELVAGFRPPRPVSAEEVREAIIDAGLEQVLVVLDDDPTGTQSVAGLPVLTGWEADDFRWAFSQSAAAIYVMTNSRSLAPDTAEAVTREVVTTAVDVARQMGINPVFVSRSDSTLRGHFPLETRVITAASGQQVDGIILIPAFDEAGRVTVGGVHYCRVGQDYLPVGETEFAKDATFGYRASRLAEWVEEKTEGAVRADDVVLIGLDTLRGEPDAVRDAVMALKDGAVLTADIVTEEDLRALSLALISAEGAGKRFVYRVGPPFVRARIGQEKHAPVSPAEIEEARRWAGAPHQEPLPHGLVVVGSHVGVTQRQLTHLKENVAATVLEVEVAKVVDTAQRDAHLQDLIDQAVAALDSGSVIVQTSRTLVTGADGHSSLDISRQVSAAVVAVVHGILSRRAPAFVLAKGGITSSDVASKGLEIRHGLAVGPMLPGIVSLWVAQDGPARGIPYIVFPGNVGDDASLTAVVKRLQGAADAVAPAR